MRSYMLIHLVPSWCRALVKRSVEILDFLNYLQKGEDFPSIIWKVCALKIEELGQHLIELDWDLIDSLEEDAIEKIDQLITEVFGKWGAVGNMVSSSGWKSDNVQQRQREIPGMIFALNEIMKVIQVHPSQNFLGQS